MEPQRLVLFADTHVPERARDLPDQLWHAIDRADVVVHAGDWVHETGAARGRERRCEEAYADADILVFGHGHIPWDTTTDSGLRLLDPGSPTDRRHRPFCAYMTLAAVDGDITDVALHRLPPRTPAGRR